MKIQQTPFFIWSNCPMKSETIENISLNYLSQKMIEAAGLPKNIMQQFLDHSQKEIPIINRFGYVEKDGIFYTKQQNSPYSKYINNYEIVSHYRMFYQKVKFWFFSKNYLCVLKNNICWGRLYKIGFVWITVVTFLSV